MNLMSEAPRLLTIPEVAAILQVSQRTVFRWMDAGLLPVVRVGKITRIRPADLEVFLQSHRAAPGPEVDA